MRHPREKAAVGAFMCASLKPVPELYAGRKTGREISGGPVPVKHNVFPALAEKERVSGKAGS
jgi:hypothetical protein